MKLTFGKHRGQPVETIPDGYLRWALRTVKTLDHRLQWEIAAELRRRRREKQAEQPPLFSGFLG